MVRRGEVDGDASTLSVAVLAETLGDVALTEVISAQELVALCEDVEGLAR